MIATRTIGTEIQRYQTDGHSPYLVLDEQLNSIILKPQNNVLDIISIQKEYLCSLLLKAWNIKCPNIYLCHIDPILYHILKERDKRFQHSEVYFGCEFLENQFELNDFFSFSGKIALRNFPNLDTIIHIALFDIWIENDDRKPTNTNLLCNIKESKLDFYAIDHAFTFASLTFDSISPDYVSFSDNDSILYSEAGRSIVKSLVINEIWLAQLKEYFYLCIAAAKKDIEIIFNTMPPYFAIEEQYKAQIKCYLFSEIRTQEAYNTLLYIINDIRK